MTLKSEISISKVIRIGTLGSQFVFLLFGLFVCLYFLPKVLRQNYTEQFNAVVQQTHWAIEKPVSYADYHAVEQYLEKLVNIEHLVAAYLVDSNGSCLAYAGNGIEKPKLGCEFLPATKSEVRGQPHGYVTGTSDFYFNVRGIQAEKKIQATVMIVSELSSLYHLQTRLGIVAAFIFGFLVLFSIFVTQWSFKVFKNEIFNIQKSVSTLSQETSLEVSARPQLSETREIFNTIRSVRQELRTLHNEIGVRQRKEAEEEIVFQVLHDIQAPLGALNVAADMKNANDRDALALIRAAIKRINNIATDLRSLNRGARKPIAIDLIKEVDAIVGEKKIQYRNQGNVNIFRTIATVDRADLSVLLSVDRIEFGRVLSNLIDNSVEAVMPSGSVEIKVSVGDQRVDIEIIDDGVGIPEERILSLGQRGMTFGKENGSGLGLYYAMKKVKSWNGTLVIESKEGLGTKVQIRFLNQYPPNFSWS